MPRRRPLLCALPLLLMVACNDDDGGDPGPVPSPTPAPSPTPTPTPTATTPTQVRIDFSFADGADGWLADYVDYANGQEPGIAFSGAVAALPQPLTGGRGLLLSSVNRSDDVFMYLTRPVEGLVPGQRYRIGTTITFATNVPPGCIGAGGAPGEAVWIKAGASDELPGRVLDDGGTIRPNFDHGQQANDGMDLTISGDFTQPGGGGSCEGGPYQRKTLGNATSGPVVQADRAGRLWLVIGTDSGFEGKTGIYYLEGSTTLSPVS